MPAARVASNPVYDVHPGVTMVKKSIAGLKAKTGRSLEEWLKLVRDEGPETEKLRRAWLQARHGLGMNYASWIAACSVGTGEDGNPDTYLKQAAEYVEKMFAGPKEPLRRIYEALLKLGRSLGKDVCPCQTIMPFYRNHVFCADQADNTHAHRSRTRAPRHENPQAADPYRRLCKERPDHASD